MTDLSRFLRVNLSHYIPALWGVNLKLDPDYPVVSKLFPSLLRDSVFEWRTYGLLPLWGGVIALLPLWLVGFLIGYWLAESFRRAGYYRTRLDFWTQAYRESPHKMRVLIGYSETLMLNLEQRYKSGEPWKDREYEGIMRTAVRLQHEIIQGSK